MGLFDGAKRFLFGRKEGPDVAAKDVRANAMLALSGQREALTGLRDLSREAPDFIRGQVNREVALSRGGEEDALRRFRQKIAQRGLGNSSLGLMGETQLGNQFAQQRRDILGTLGGRMRDARAQGLQGLLGGSLQVGAANKVPIRFRSERVGGTLPLFTTLAGAAIGSQMGDAKTGAQIGNATGQGLMATSGSRRAPSGGGGGL